MYKQLIINTCAKHNLNFEEAAYVLATADWETNHTFEPVREAYYLGKKAEAYRKKLKYYPYYGRGFVQLTWKYNYELAGKKLGRDFVNKPDAVMDPTIAAEVLVVGSKEGWFTGKSLSDYVDGIDESDKEDFLEYWNARRVINGTDKANDIAILAEKYERELKAIGYGFKSTEKPVQGVPEGPSSPSTGKEKRPWWAFLIDLIVGMFKK